MTDLYQNKYLQMDQSKKLTDYARDLLKRLDPQRQLRRLECDICSYFVNSTDKRPLIICQNQTCAKTHTICQLTMNQIIIKNKQINLHLAEDEQIPLKCPFCNRVALKKFITDKTKMTISEPLTQLMNRLRSLQYVQRDIKNLKAQNQRKSDNIQILRKGKISSEAESLRRLKQVTQKQKDLMQRQQSNRITMQKLYDQKIQITNQNIQYRSKIEQLQQQNKLLRESLAQDSQTNVIQKIVKQKRKNNILFNMDAAYNEFQFNPNKDKYFDEAFIQKKPEFIIQLRENKLSFLTARAQRKIFYHKEFFSNKRSKDRQIYFKIRGMNVNTKRYKFGLLDGELKPIENANLTINLSNMDLGDRKEVDIYFFINTNTLKLYGSVDKVNTVGDIPKNADLSKFTVFLYFVEDNTKIKLQ